jgi:hypothetical protein
VYTAGYRLTDEKWNALYKARGEFRKCLRADVHALYTEERDNGD